MKKLVILSALILGTANYGWAAQQAETLKEQFGVCKEKGFEEGLILETILGFTGKLQFKNRYATILLNESGIVKTEMILTVSEDSLERIKQIYGVNTITGSDFNLILDMSKLKLKNNIYGYRLETVEDKIEIDIRIVVKEIETIEEQELNEDVKLSNIDYLKSFNKCMKDHARDHRSYSDNGLIEACRRQAVTKPNLSPSSYHSVYRKEEKVISSNNINHKNLAEILPILERVLARDACYQMQEKTIYLR